MNELPLRHEKGNWSVLRNCCQSGNCFECRSVTPYGQPLQIVHGAGYSERYAKIVASRWDRYKAIAKEGL